MNKSKITFWVTVLALSSAVGTGIVEPSWGGISAILGWFSATLAWFIITKKEKYE